MLQHSRAHRSDLVAEIEQAGTTGERVDAPRAQVDGANARRLAVGDVEDAALQAQARGLRERRILPRPIDERLAAISGDRLDGAFAQIDHRDLVRACQRDVELVIAQGQVPGRAQRGLLRDALLDERSPPELESPGEPPQLASLQIGDEDRMGARVRDVERIAVEGDALRIVEGRFRERAFPRAAQPAADGVLHGAVRAQDEHAVVARVAHHDPSVARGRDLAGIAQRGDRRPPRAAGMERRPRQRPFLAAAVQLVGDQRF